MSAYAFETSERQAELWKFINDGRFNYIAYGGAIRGGKTIAIITAVVVLARLFPGSRWAIVRKDHEILRRNTYPSFEKVRKWAGGFVGPINGNTHEATCTNGSVIVFAGENIDRDPHLDKFDGFEVNGFALEEADELQEKTFYKCIERAGAWVVPDLPKSDQPPPYVFCTFNPCANWPKAVFYDPWKEGTIAPPYAFVPADIDDNPFLTEEYRDSLENLPDEEYQLRVQGDWEQLSGRFYRTLDKTQHLISPSRLPYDERGNLPDWWEYWGSFDWGYSHWSVFGAWAKDGDGNVYLLDSVWVRQEEDDAAIARSILASGVPRKCTRFVYAGHDCWAQVKHRSGSGITTFEAFLTEGVVLVRADIDLINGGRAVRSALKVTNGRPRTFIVNTESTHLVAGKPTRNQQRVYEQLAATMPDENNVHKPGKVDADASGRGGDDGENMFRYGVASRIAEVQKLDKVQKVDEVIDRVSADGDRVSVRVASSTTPRYAMPRPPVRGRR